MNDQMISLENCKHGYVYEIDSRNLSHGVFNSKDNGFIGIRNKFRNNFLFTEYHWDTGEPYGTVIPLKELEKVPDDIEIKVDLGIIDSFTGKLINFDKPVVEGGKGWYFVETGVVCANKNPVTLDNKKLFEYLNKFKGIDNA